MDTSTYREIPCFDKNSIKTQCNTEFGWIAYLDSDTISDYVYSEKQRKKIRRGSINFNLSVRDDEAPPELKNIAACIFFGEYLNKISTKNNSNFEIPVWLKDDLVDLFGEECKRLETTDLANFYAMLPVFHSESISNEEQAEFRDFKNGKIEPKNQYQIMWRKYVAHDLYKKGLRLQNRSYWDGIRLLKRALSLGHAESLVFLTTESESLFEELKKRDPGESKECWKELVEIDGYFFLDDEIPIYEAYDISDFTPDFYGDKTP